MLTKSDVGLANVDNTSDANKPISAATQTALNGKAASAHTHSEADITNLVSDLAGKQSTPIFTVLANDTLAQNYAVNTGTQITVTASRTLTTTVPAAGQVRYTKVLTSGASSFTITFGAGFKPTGTLATGTTTARVFILAWLSDGTNLYEVSRTAAMPA